MIGFLTPQEVPSIEDEGEFEEHGIAIEPDQDLILDRQEKKAADGDDHKPFMRKLNEFGFWEGVTLSIGVACGLSFFKVFDIPVFWP